MCADKRITVDMFLFAQSQLDVATISEVVSLRHLNLFAWQLTRVIQVTKSTGGHVYYYGPGLAAEELGNRLYPDLTKNLVRGTGYDALMRVRCSAGLSVKTYEVTFRVLRLTSAWPHNCSICWCIYQGHLRVTENKDVELASVDSDKTIAVLLQHDETISDKTKPVFQAAVLYTTHDGQRRIRVHTLQLPTTTALPSVVRSADVYTSVALMARHAIKEVSRASLQGTDLPLTCAAYNNYANFPLHSWPQRACHWRCLSALLLQEELLAKPCPSDPASTTRFSPAAACPYIGATQKSHPEVRQPLLD